MRLLEHFTHSDDHSFNDFDAVTMVLIMVVELMVVELVVVELVVVMVMIMLVITVVKLVNMTECKAVNPTELNNFQQIDK